MNDYLKLKEQHSTDYDNFPMFFAFNKKQFEEGMEKFGLKPTDTDKMCRGFGGAIYRKTDAKRMKDMVIRHNLETEQAIIADVKGDGFIFEMFNYELANHEYSYTMDATDTLEGLGMTMKQIQENEALANGFQRAINMQYDCSN